ncbi:MAG: Fur family transcriptional regulator [Planctomycetota bacterium]|nr:Fur family transcriptional regulator [Planctomycetota bacterium]MDP6519186.1 Fur family transcriptional regulator [Planctomycetota bacterium]MDP6838084.1 Fur family transcriptional regulator [Planctomycetota bacterium]
MEHAAIVKRYRDYLSGKGLRLTKQRRRILDRVYGTHDHFSAETLLRWLAAEQGAPVSRATVYRTLEMMVSGGFLAAVDTGGKELLYEHALGHSHHDHMVCITCGSIEEFVDEEIERRQSAACAEAGFTPVRHLLRIRGYCRSCGSPPD